MLTGERIVTTATPSGEGGGYRRPGTAAAVLGFLGAVLAVAVPFLPVVEHTAAVVWPSPSTGFAQVNAPLVALQPESMTTSVPCSAVRSLDARTAQRATVFATVPPESTNGARSGMAITVENGNLVLVDRGQQLMSAPVSDGACLATVVSDGTSTTADLGSGPQTFAGDVRPQVTGIYSDLDPAADPMAGVSARVSPDTRFDTSPTVWKQLASAAALLCLAGSLAAVRRLDRGLGRREYRSAPNDQPAGADDAAAATPRRTPAPPGRQRWWRLGRPRPLDATVAAVLVAWMAIGAQTSDDGFTLGIVRNVPTSGYVGNYYRWYNAAEAPFGWFYDLYAWWAQVSDSLLWLRLPSVLMGLVAWWLISRGLLPRLGRQARRSRAATWAAAGVFLAFWMGYDSGLRPEPPVVVCSLLALVAVERTVALRRMTPLVLGLVAATLAIGANPAGVIAVAPFLAAARQILALVRERMQQLGAAPVLGPIALGGTAILTVAFADQSWAAVVESTRFRSMIGPNWGWYSELATRYGPLFSESADGSVARRFPVLLLLLCTVACTVVLIRRSRIPGAATGPAQRLIASTVISLLLLSLTPTKWTHHFGDLVGLGAGTVALAALATGSQGLRSLRNRLAFLGGVTAVAALSFAGPNTWWYTNNWGVPWFDKPPSVNGYQASTLLLFVAALLLAAGGVEHLRGLREHRPAEQLGALQQLLSRLPLIGRWRNRDRSGAFDVSARRALRALRLTTAPLALLCALVVMFNLASMIKAIDKQSGSWSMGHDALTHPLGGSCGLAGRVFAERRPADGVLPAAPMPTGMAPPAQTGLLPIVVAPSVPEPGRPATPLPPGAVLAGSPSAQLIDPTPGNSGFRRGGTPPTGGGTGVSGYEYVVPGGLGGDNAPAYGSFGASGRTTGTLRTPWVELTSDQRDGSTPMVVTAAGTLSAGNSLTIQYAVTLADGRVQVIDQAALDDGRGAEAPWREVRFNLPASARQATQARLIAQDNTLGPQGWLAVGPLRAPQLAPLADVVGRQPMFLEYPVSLASPCLRPFSTRSGIAEIPAFRLQADDSRMRTDGENWSGPEAGGPLGWMKVVAKQTEIPTYLDGDPTRDWGRLQAVELYRPDAVAPTVERQALTRSGTYSSGELPDPPPGVPSPER